MRVILTIIAVVLVVVLTTALIVPYFVDWSAHRDEIAARLEGFAGGPVTLAGPVTLRLLPTPYLDVGAGTAAAAGAGAPRLAFAGARLELALVKLASGTLRFTDVEFEKPVLTLTRSRNGALIGPMSAPASAGAIGFDRFSVRDGTIVVLDAAGANTLTIDGVALDGDALSVAGPYHVGGQASGPGGAPVVFRLVSEAAGPDGAPVRGAIDAGPTWPALQFDGTAAVFGAAGFRADGALALNGTSPGVEGALPWAASGRLAANLDGARLANASFRFGPEERALRAEGSAALAAKPFRLTIDAKAKEANLDALLRRKGEDAVPPERAAKLIMTVLANALSGGAPIAVDARLAVAAAILGGGSLDGLAASVEAKPGAPLATRFDLGLPGRTRIRGEGHVERGAAARFEGRVDVSTEDPAGLGRWAGQGESAQGFAGWTEALAEAAPAASLAASGNVVASAERVAADAMKISVGRSVLTGSLAVALPTGAAPGRIDANLAADPLDVEALPSLDAARSLAEGYDVALALDAKALSVAHVGEAGIEGASLVLRMARTGPRLTIDRVDLAGLGGASLTATGALGPDGASASGRLEAAKLEDFAKLAERLAPGVVAHALVERASLLSPASLAFEATGRPAASGADLMQSAKATGTLAGTKASLAFERAAAGDQGTAALSLDSPDSAALVAQFGLLKGAPAAQGSHAAGHVEGRASGAWASGYDIDASAALAGAVLTGRGRLVPTAAGDEARLFGAVKVAGDNLAPLASLLGLAAPGAAIGPVDASADVTLRGARLAISRIAATLGSVRASGALAYEAPEPEALRRQEGDVARALEAAEGPAAAQAPPPPALTGDIAFDRLRLADLAALALGPEAPPRPGAVWPDAAFGAPPIVPPATAVHVSAGRLGLSDTLAAEGFSTNLKLAGGRLDLDDMAMRLSGGAISGHATLRRGGEAATLEAALAAEPTLLKRPGATGRLGGRLDFASTGRSVAGLVAGLAGDGSADFAGVEIAKSDPDALARVVAAAQAENARIDETNVGYALAAALDRGPLALPDGSTPATVSAGAIKLGPVKVARPDGAATLSATLDLGRMTLETETRSRHAGQGAQILVGPESERSRRGRGRARPAAPKDRRGRSRGRACDSVDRARIRAHRDPRGRHPRARLLQSAAQGRALSRPPQRGDRGLARRAGAPEGSRRASRGAAGRGAAGGGEGRSRKGCGGEGRDGQGRGGEGRGGEGGRARRRAGPFARRGRRRQQA